MPVNLVGFADTKKMMASIVVATSGPNLKPACAAGAKRLAEGMRRRAPRDTGQLVEALDVLDGETKTGPTRASVPVGVVDGDADYWRYQEYGTSKMEANPYIRPTIDEEGGEIALATAAHIARQIGAML